MDKNGASLDPFRDGGLWEHYVEMVVQPEQPQVYEQLQLPYEDNIYVSLGRTIAPYRWATYLQDALQQYCSTSDYTVGRAEREDIVNQIVEERKARAFDDNEVRELDKALEIWRSVHGNF